LNLLKDTRTRVAAITLGAVGLALATAGPALAVTGTPVTPTDALNNGAACATDQSNPYWANPGSWLTIEARPDLADVTGTTDGSAGVTVTEQYRVYPVDDPTQITSYSLSVGAQLEGVLWVPGSVFTDGQTYVWQAQTVFDGASSDWSAPCYVAVDKTPPSAAPTIVSTNYPTGTRDQAGAPIHVTFGADGVSDVIGYTFSWNVGFPVPNFSKPLSDPYVGSAGSVLADAQGGSATLNLVPAQPSGFMILDVWSVDRAGNISPEATYQIFAGPTAPTITLQGDKPKYGVQTPFLLTPDPGLEAASPVTSYQVVESTDAGQQELTVPADSNGDATIHVTDDSEWGTVFWVQSVSADGWVSDNNSYSIDDFPAITSDVYQEDGVSGGAGVPGTFDFTSPIKDISGFTYTVNGGPATTVHAADGKASITFTPPASGWYDIEVTPVAKDGGDQFPNDYYFGVS